MVSGYNNFPEEMFDNGDIIMGKVIPGLYNKISDRFNNHKPFLASFTFPGGVKLSCCPLVSYEPNSKSYLIVIDDNIIALGMDNIIAPFTE